MGNRGAKPEPEIPQEGYLTVDGTEIKYITGAHNPDEEIEKIASYDNIEWKGADEVYLIHAGWMKKWLSFVDKKTNKAPKRISNKELMSAAGDSIRKDVEIKTDFRPVSRDVWQYYFLKYGGGPVIYFNMPLGLPETEYSNGKWVKRIVFREVVQILEPVITGNLPQIKMKLFNPMKTVANKIIADMFHESELAQDGLDELRYPRIL